MNSPKTAPCCGVKPKRIFYQTGFRDDEGTFHIQCPVCSLTVTLKNNHKNLQACKDEATIKWNEFVLTKKGR